MATYNVKLIKECRMVQEVEVDAQNKREAEIEAISEAQRCPNNWEIDDDNGIEIDEIERI